MNKKIGALCALLAGCLWGCTGISVRALTAAGLSSFNISFFRSFLAFFLFSIYLLIFKKTAFRIRLKDLWCFIGTGVVSLAMFNICYFTTIRLTTLAVAAILLYTSPVFVLILSAFFFKEKFTLRKAASVLLVVVGCALVSGILGGIGITPQTLLFGLGAGLSYALYSIFSRFALSRGYSSETVSVYTFFFSSLTLLPFSDLPAAFSALSKGTPIVFLFTLSVVSTLTPYLLYTLSLTVVENGKAAVLAATEPVTAALVGFLFLGDPLPDLPAIFGMLMVLGAILLCNLTFTRRKKDERL